MIFQKNKRLIPPFYKLDDAVREVTNFDNFESHVYNSNDSLPLHFISIGDTEKFEGHDVPGILFVHGSPGSWEGWAEYLYDPILQSKAFMVAVDRPGYAKSDKGVSGASLKMQSDAIMSAMKDSFPAIKQWIIVGHSYGGPVSLRIAADYPNNMKSALLLAPAISPSLIRIRFYNRLANVPIIYSVIPTPLKRSNDEMYLLSNETVLLQTALKNIQTPVTVIQGERDGIVNPVNATYAEEELVNTTVKTILLPKRGHFLPWEEFELIKETLLKKL